VEKSLDVVNIADAQIKVSDIKVVGNGDAFQLLCKASSKDQGWMKSTKAMYIENIGCVVQSSTQQGDNVAESLTFVPGVKVVDDVNGGRKLVPMWQDVNLPVAMKIEGNITEKQMEEVVDRVKKEYQ
jgi:hypothetical protein